MGKNTLPAIVATCLLALYKPLPVLAQWNDLYEGDVASIKSLEGLFETVVKALVSLIGLTLFVVLLSGGFNYLFAGGDPKKMEKAKGTMSGAMLGIVIIVAAYLIIQLVAEFTGVDSILNFTIDSGN